MGAETAEWYNKYCLIGFADKRGKAWHYKQSAQGAEPNHYPGAIPVDDVLRRLFHWQAVSAEVNVEYYDEATNDMVSILDTTRQAIIRPDTKTVFGIFKQGYTIHQHDEWLINLASTLLDQSVSDLGIANAVLLKGGAVACVQYEVPETIKLPSGVEFRPSLLTAGSLDGSLATTIARTVVNVVCDNTMAASLGDAKANGSIYKLRHTKNSGLKIDDARQALELVYDIADDFAREVQSLIETTVTGKQFRQYLDITVPVPDEEISVKTGKVSNNKAITMAERKRDELLTLWMHDDRVSPWAGTAYGVLQMNNTYNHHLVGTNGDTVRGERNMFNAASGAFSKSDGEALDTLFTKVLQSV